MKKKFARLGTIPFLVIGSLSAYAATPINLANQSPAFLHSVSDSSSAIRIKEVSRDRDFNQTVHVRIKQTYQGYPVWGSDGVVHIPHASDTKLAVANAGSATTMNGTMYNDINKDLIRTPAVVFEQAQADKALQHAITTYQQQIGGTPKIKDQESHLMVYIDKANKAHWAFQVGFYAAPIKATGIPAKQRYIMDAQSFAIYKSWNDVKSDLEAVDGGGIGGNLKTGQLFYDGVPSHLASFIVSRDAATNTCFLENNDVIVKNDNTSKLIEYSCKTKNGEHNNLYWHDLDDQANGGYSPNNDAIFTITRLKEMYDKWYGIAPVMENGKSVPVTVYTHVDMENAYWEGKSGNEWIIKLGDGADRMYPSTAPGVIAHELGHGFTEQHSNLVYDAQSGGLNESFSDMADQAMQYYALGKNNWMHDAEITKAEGKALRYLDDPTKDCEGTGTPGVNCSIINMSQYNDSTDVHYSSGIFNHVFYLIGTAKNWDTKKAFDVMIKSNMHYWVPNTTFAEAACGVIQATKDYNYDLSAVLSAFDAVGVDTSKCKK